MLPLSPTSRTLALLASLLLCLPRLASADGLTKLEGKAGQVGNSVALGRANMRLSGAFRFQGGLDLSTVAVTIRELLDETGGGGELVKGADGLDLLPVTLNPASGARPDWVKLERSGGLRPSFRLEIKARPDGLFNFKLKVTGGSIPQNPLQCEAGASAVLLASALEITAPALVEPIVLEATSSWHAPGPGLVPIPCSTGKLTTRVEASSSGGSGNEDPTASLRVENVTREEDEPNLVELDGSGSQDRDGTIASYEFRVNDRATNDVIFGPQVSTESRLQVLLDPGEYIGRLRVTDNQGEVSDPNYRAFRVP